MKSRIEFVRRDVLRFFFCCFMGLFVLVFGWGMSNDQILFLGLWQGFMNANKQKEKRICQKQRTVCWCRHCLYYIHTTVHTRKEVHMKNTEKSHLLASCLHERVSNQLFFSSCFCFTFIRLITYLDQVQIFHNFLLVFNTAYTHMYVLEYFLNA